MTSVPREPNPMTRLTPLFLVLLRLAIGWHIFFEGLEKVQDPSWSSAGYLRESAGPLAGQFQELGGDPVLDRMTPLDASAGGPKDRFPPALAREWQAYFEQFADHYGLDDQQRLQAQSRLEQRREQTALWLIQGKETTRKPTQFGVVEQQRSTPDRLADYRQALATYRRKKDEAGQFGEGAVADLGRARAELARQRGELLADLDRQTAEMKTALASVLSEEQKKKDPLIEQPPSRWQTFTSLDWLRWGRLDWTDFLVRWGLLAVGICLLAGLFTRTACIAGAVFLLLFYLPMPPWPGLPDNPRAEGHYLFINKNVIEMLALLALATTASGRWVGLDALIASGRGGQRATTEPQAAPEAVPDAEPIVPPVAAAAETAERAAPTDAPGAPGSSADRPDPSTIIYSPKEE